MKGIERKDLLNAVLVTRDEIDPDLDGELLEDIVDAETESAGDRDSAMRAINAALHRALDRGVRLRRQTECGGGHRPKSRR